MKLKQLFESPDMIDTPAFKVWFGNSKVVDKNGTPLRVYHSTGQDFGVRFGTEPDRNVSHGIDGIGAWFAEEPMLSNAVAKFHHDKRDAPSPNTIPVYLSITNPFVVTSRNTFMPRLIQYTITRTGKEWTMGRAAAIRNEIQSANAPTVAKQIKNSLIEDGFDGIHLLDDTKMGPAWIAFHSNQIKSAISNRGKYDPSNDDITEAYEII